MTTAPSFSWTAWTTLAALAMYGWIFFNVGRARGKFGIKAPVMEGPAAFASVVRVHANTVEQIVLFLPALWLCAIYRSDYFAAIVGVVWIIGRIMYALGYYRDPSKRGPGFGVSLLASAILMVGAATGLINA
ncbi:MAG: MAPEG family protein [Burkholderiaceae bacterium]